MNENSKINTFDRLLEEIQEIESNFDIGIELQTSKIKKIIIKIKMINLNERIYIDKILAFLSDKKQISYADRALSYSLIDLKINTTQLNTILRMMKRNSIEEYVKRYFLFVLLENSQVATTTLYKIFKMPKTLLIDKINISEELIKYQNYEEEISKYLIDTFETHELPKTYDNLDSTVIQLECFDILKGSIYYEHYHDRFIKTLMEIFKDYDDIICVEGEYWTEITQIFLSLVPKEKDIILLLNCLKYEKSNIFRESEFVSMLIEIETDYDILGEFMQILQSENISNNIKKHIVYSLPHFDLSMQDKRILSDLTTSDEMSQIIKELII